MYDFLFGLIFFLNFTLFSRSIVTQNQNLKKKNGLDKNKIIVLVHDRRLYIYYLYPDNLSVVRLSHHRWPVNYPVKY